MDANTSFTSPLATVGYGSINVPPQVEFVFDTLVNLSFWTVFWSLLALAVAYDQRMFVAYSQLSREKKETTKKKKNRPSCRW